MASNDGLGGFEPTGEVPLLTTSFFDHSIALRGSDFDGDGLLDLAVSEGGIVELWYNWGSSFDPFLELSGGLAGLADGDGDGDVDLLVRGYDGESYYVTLWLNDGYDFVHSDTLFFGREEERPYLLAGQPLGEAVSLLWNLPCYQSLGPWQLTRPWATVQELPLSFEAEVNPCALHLLADFDGNGMVDLLGSPKSIETFLSATDYYGLALWRMDASGVLASDSLLDWNVFPSVATASDLNGDGLLDVALIASNLTIGSALVVLLGQRNDVPVLEGYYPLPGEGSQVLTGDVNGDGDTDLVVLGTSLASDDGGVSVFINQGTPATAVASETAATPMAFCFRCQLSQPVQSRHDHPLGRARRSQRMWT